MKNLIKSLLRRATTNTIMQSGFLLITALPLMVLLVWVGIITQNNLSGQVEVYSAQLIEQMAITTQYKLSDYTHELFKLAINEELEASLTNERSSHITLDILNEAYRGITGDMGTLAAMSADGVLQFHGHGGPYAEGNIRTQKITQVSSKSIIQNKTTSGVFEYRSRFYIVVAVPCYNFIEKQCYGSVAASFPVDEFFDEDTTDAPKYNESYLVSSDGTILYHNDTELIGGDFNEISAGKEEEGFVYNGELLSVVPGWELINETDTAAMRNDTLNQLAVALGLLFVFVLAYILFVRYFIKKMLSSLGTVTDAMEHAGRHDFVAINKPAMLKDMQMVYDGYNAMIYHIEQKNTEMKNLYSEQISTLKQIQSMQLKTLELQINPHFLYNTLNTINCVALRNNDIETSELLAAFSHMLRYLISNSEKLVILREEQVWLEKYLSLSLYRYDHSFDYRLDFSPDTLDIFIHRLVFQPFVENSILHGFNTQKTGQLLILKSFMIGEILCLQIIDNGIGMPPDKLERINGLLDFTDIKNDSDETDEFGIGLRNTKQRLIFYYGERLNLSFDSVEGKGTTVTIKIKV